MIYISDGDGLSVESSLIIDYCKFEENISDNGLGYFKFGVVL
jgi:hypothetical protein